MKERKTDRPCKEGKKKKEIDMRIRRGMEGGRRRGEERVGGEGEKGREERARERKRRRQRIGGSGRWERGERKRGRGRRGGKGESTEKRGVNEGNREWRKK